VTLFTSHNAEVTTRAEVQLAGVDVPLEHNSKILRVVHDTSYTFSQHCKNTRDKIQKRVNVLKALADTT